MSINIGVFGATGYTGLELIQRLERHPHVSIRFATSERSAGKSLRHSWPTAPDIHLVSSADAPLDEVDFIFLCLPHTRSALVAAQALRHQVRVIDLSADLRIEDAAIYERWYGVPHPAPEMLPVPYGLPEIERAAISGAACVANPGCYATAVLLGLVPLARHGVLAPGAPIIVDAKSGVSGAGRTPKQHTLYTEVAGNFSPYNIGRSHRHLAEIEQMLVREGVSQGRVIFSPHLLPTERGILAAIYAQVIHMGHAEQAFRSMYDSELMVDVLPPGELATLAHVVRTPRAVISLTPGSESLLIVMVAIDNLLKGAASQAIQNFNLMAGFPETTALSPAEESIV